MNLLRANNIIRQARECGVLLFVERGVVYAYPINNLPQRLREAVRTSHDYVRELLILAAL